MKVAAIIGADSMLGRELAAQLRQKDIAVVSIGRGKHHEVVLDLAAPLNHYSCQGITADIVFHCAATFEGDSLAKARTNFITNAAGCCNVLQLMKQLECNACIFAGTVSSIEHFDFSPMSSYSISKSQGEKILEWGMAQTKGLFCSLRFSQLYDTEGLCCSHQPWLGRIIAYTSRGLDLCLPPSCGVRNFVHITDAARLMIRAAELGLNGTWPLCHFEMPHISQIAEIAYGEFNCGGRIIIDHNKKPFRLLNFPKDRSIFERLQCDLSISMAEGIAMIHRGGQAGRFGPMDVR